MNRREYNAEKKTKKITRGALIFGLLLMCGFFLFFVGLNASASQTQYEINQINNQISETKKDITNLEVKIKSASNITNIEQKAIALGMVYPDIDQIIYISGDHDIQEFASALMETVYR